jgi:hypothetical protein
LETNPEQTKSQIVDDTLLFDVGAKTKYRWKPKKGVILLALPTLNAQLTQKSELETLRSLKASNIFLGLYIPNFNNILTASFFQGYNKGTTLNDDFESLESESAYVGTELSYKLRSRKGFASTIKVGQTLVDFQTPHDTDTTDEADSYRVNAGIIPEFVTPGSKVFSLKAPLTYKKTWYKERRALTETGTEGAPQADTLENLRWQLKPQLTSWGLTLKPSLGRQLKRDLSNGARNYEGVISTLEASYQYERHALSSLFDYEKRDYQNQLVNTLADRSTSPLLNTRIRSFMGKYSYKPQSKRLQEVSLSHEKKLIDSNRDSDNSNNSISKIEMRFSL